MRRSRAGGLSQKLTAFALTTIGVTASVLGVLFYSHAWRQARFELVLRGTALASNTAENTRRGAEMGNVFRSLDPIVKAASRQPDVLRVRVLDESGKTLADAGSGEGVSAGGAFTVGSAILSAGDLLASPGSPGVARPIGRVEVTLSLAGFRTKLRHTAGLFLALITAVMACGAASALALGRQLAQPLEAISEAAVKIRLGEYGILVPSSSLDELGSLAEAFNAMSRALVETTGMLEKVVESLVSAVVVVDSAGRIRRVNQAVCGLTGNEPDELIGKPVESLFEAAGNPLQGDSLGRLLLHGTLRGQPARLRLKSGGGLPLLVDAAVVRDADGRPYAVVAVGRTGFEG